MNLLLGKLNQTWPEWEIVEKIGEGSFGEVYKAVRHDFAGTTYAAIKAICIPKDEEEIEELKAEGFSLDQSYTYFQQVVKDYTHEIRLMDSVKGYTNIVSIDDYKIVESDDEMLWFIFIRMELLTPLVKKVAIDEIREADVIRAGIDLCSALDVCRKKNIVHRDIKPQNIFVNDEGNYKLGDFGVARSLSRAATNLSKKGAPNYMAPELYRSALREINIDDAAKVDIYSLGLVLYWMGNNSKLPFVPTGKQITTPDEREKAFVRRISGEAFPGPNRVSPELQRIILKACAYKPEDRYASAEEMKRDLIALQDGNQVSREKPKKRWWIIPLIAFAIVMILALLPKPDDSFLSRLFSAATVAPEPSDTPELAKTPTPMPAPTPTDTPTPKPDDTSMPEIPVGEMINRYGITNVGNQAIRSQPDENEDNIISRLDKDRYVYLLRADINDAGESWTYVEWKTGEFGYVKTEYLALLTQKDSEAWDSIQETPAPIYPVLPTSMQTPEPAQMSEPVQTSEPASVPNLSTLYTGSNARLHEFGAANTNERITLYAGPGKEYGKTIKMMPSSQKKVTAYFVENGWVFTNILHTGGMIYMYVPQRYFDYLEDLPEIETLGWVAGTVTKGAIPRLGHNEEYAAQEDCSAAAGTTVKAFFTEGLYTYCEYSCSLGIVRLWLPTDTVELTGD